MSPYALRSTFKFAALYGGVPPVRLASVRYASLGFRLVGHRLELFGVRLRPARDASDDDSQDGNEGGSGTR